MKKCLSILLLILPLLSYAQKDVTIPAIGVVQTLENASMLKEHGYAYIVESVGRIISPRSVTEPQFRENVTRVKQSAIPVYAFNIFIPGNLKVVGPDVNEQAVLAYADSVLQRCKATGVQRIIWGSGGSRRVPEGFDHEKARYPARHARGQAPHSFTSSLAHHSAIFRLHHALTQTRG